ncbi:MAG: HlyD family secretion protein [Bacteroidia bacterium]
MEATAKKKVSPKKMMPIILGLVLLTALIFGVKEYLYLQKHIDTDDAQIDGDLVPVISRAGGYVEKINFQENEKVTKGQELVTLDNRDYLMRVEEANASLTAAKTNVNVSKASVESAQANIPTVSDNIAAAKVRVWKATQDFNRYQNLLNDHSITQAQFDAVKADKEAAEAQLAATESQSSVINKQVQAVQQQVDATSTNIAVQQANVDYANLQLSYCDITAPASGIASKKNVQVGQLVQPGQMLFAIVSDSDIYVTANFKETQMDKLKVGEKVDIKVDAYPDMQLEGEVFNFSPATGAKFSLLPPDNATGNFVKVVQRIPVKIKINADKAKMALLRPGMSVNISVNAE